MECVPITFIIASRRLAFLHDILHENENSVIFKVFKAQCNQPLKDDWCTENKTKPINANPKFMNKGKNWR